MVSVSKLQVLDLICITCFVLERGVLLTARSDKPVSESHTFTGNHGGMVMKKADDFSHPVP